jgi:NADH-quinone oxidoreductase subunit E
MPKAILFRKFQKVGEILEQHQYEASNLIAILQKVQDEYRYLPEEVLLYVAEMLHIPTARIYGVATFYSHFTLAPKGKYLIRLCDGTACHVKSSTGILEALRKKLGLSESKITTDDMLFTVETVSCLGACGLAPVVVVNGDIYGQMTPEKAVELVDSILVKEEKNALKA